MESEIFTFPNDSSHRILGNAFAAIAISVFLISVFSMCIWVSPPTFFRHRSLWQGHPNFSWAFVRNREAICKVSTWLRVGDWFISTLWIPEYGQLPVFQTATQLMPSNFSCLINARKNIMPVLLFSCIQRRLWLHEHKKTMMTEQRRQMGHRNPRYGTPFNSNGLFKLWINRLADVMIEYFNWIPSKSYREYIPRQKHYPNLIMIHSRQCRIVSNSLLLFIYEV